MLDFCAVLDQAGGPPVLAVARVELLQWLLGKRCTDHGFCNPFEALTRFADARADYTPASSAPAVFAAKMPWHAACFYIVVPQTVNES